MGFPDLFSGFLKKEPAQQTYLSLVLAPDRVLASIWDLKDGNVQFLGFGQKNFKNPDTLLHQAAIAIDLAAEAAKSEVTKTVFGLSQFWLQNNQPKDETNKLLKSLKEDLELDPQAFVSLSAAINHFEKIEHMASPQAILIGVFENFCEVHLLKNSQITATNVSNVQVTPDQLPQLIATLKKPEDSLPPHIILYGAASDFAAQLSDLSWGDLFVQEPKIETLNDEQLAQAVAYAQAQDVLGREPQAEPITSSPVAEGGSAQKPTDETGFIKDVDLLMEEAGLGDQTPPQDQTEQPVSKPLPKPSPREEYAVNVEEYNNVKAPSSPASKVSFRFPLAPQKLAIAILGLLITGLVGLYIASLTLTSAEVVIKVSGQNLEKDFNTDIPGQEVSAQASGSQKAVATGSKKIGEPARGDVTVFNWTQTAKSFPKSTVLLTKNGLKFTLDSDIQVASRSASTPGQTKSAVKAVDFGPSGNVAAGTDFTLQEFDELLYSARNENALTGGSEKQATVATVEDLSRLEKSLTDSLLEKAKKSLSEKVAGQKAPESTQAIKVTRRDFDKKAQEEASLINLEMELTVSSLVYKEEDLKNSLAEGIRDIPDNLQVRPENLEIISIQNVGRNKDLLTLNGKLRARLTPKIVEEELKGKIAGKSVKEARSIIKGLGEITDVIVNFSPNLPLAGRLPNDKSKIRFKIEVT